MQISELNSLINSGKICKNDVMKCIFGLNDIEVEIFCNISKEGVDVKYLMKKVKRDRTTVQRCLKSLIALGIVSRKGLNLKRGRKYVYFSIPNEKLREIFITKINEYCESLKKMINLIK